MCVPACSAASTRPVPTSASPTSPRAGAIVPIPPFRPYEAIAARESLIDRLTPAERATSEGVALADSRVSSLLNKHRYSVAFMDLSELGSRSAGNLGCTGSRGCVQVTIVDYTGVRTITALVNLPGRFVRAVWTYPNILVPVQEKREEQLLVRIISDDVRVISLLAGRQAELLGNASAGTRDGSCAHEGHRCVIAFLRVQTDQLTVIVDLGAEVVQEWRLVPGWYRESSASA
jgi:hypothetical protein